MTKVFGTGSTEWNEAKTNPALAQTDFVGIAIHCAQGSRICNPSANAKDDLLPQEPGGYTGFKGLFGAKYVNRAITNNQPVVKDMSGADITDPAGNPGFPGFDGMPAKVSLAYVAQMQEAGVPITFAYISDAHDNHDLRRASGPGESDYVTALHAYDRAPTIYLAKPTAAPPTAAQIREFERKLAAARGIDPYVDPSSPRDVMLFMADTVGEKALHMVNGDPRRTPDFTYFANPDYFLTTTNTAFPKADPPSSKVATCVDN